MKYSISVENKDPNKAEHSFYPELNHTIHYYSNDNDTLKGTSLIIALDYNWHITPMVVGQFGQSCPILHIPRSILSMPSIRYTPMEG